MTITTSTLPFLLGAVTGAWLAVHIFLWIAGVRFTKWRHVLSAYLVALIVAIFVSAVGDADGGPPDFTSAPLRSLGVFIAFLIDLTVLKGRKPVETNPRASA